MVKRVDYQRKTKKDKQGIIKEDKGGYKRSMGQVDTSLPYNMLEVENFRCIKSLTIGPFEQVNLITGINNVGKTALLEAIFLHIGEINPELALRIDGWRGLGPDYSSSWRQLFWQFDPKTPIKITATGVKDKKRSLTISTTPADATIIENAIQREKGTAFKSSGVLIQFEYTDENGEPRKAIGTPLMFIEDNVVRFELRIEPPIGLTRFAGVFLNPRGKTTYDEDVQRFSQMRIKQQDRLLIDAMRLIEPRLEGLEILSPQGITLIFGHLRDYNEPIPLPLLGDGIRRLASLILAMSAAQRGVVLVDEIENGLHHSVMTYMWNMIAEAATQFNTQVIATTHSQECVVAAHDAFSNRKEYSFRLHRLDRQNGEITAATYDQETLEAALSIPLEVRG